MLILYPDTNALYADLLMRGLVSARLIEALLPNHVEVALSPVVLAEARRRAEEAGEKTANRLRDSVRAVEQKHGVSTTAVGLPVEVLLTKLHAASSRALSPLTEHEACRVLDWPRVHSEELVAREIERRPPTRLQGGQSIGLRDTLIWHGLVDLMRYLDEQDRVIFITEDGGFLEGKSLARALLTELREEAIDPGQLRVVARLENAFVEVDEYRAQLTRQEGMIRQVVIDRIAAFDGQTWAAVDVSGEAPMRYGVEEGFVAAVDSISIESTFGTPPTTVEAIAEVTISGFMRSDEYVQEHAEDVEWMDGELYDPMINVEFTSAVVLEAEVALSDAGDEAWIVDETLRWVD